MLILVDLGQVFWTNFYGSKSALNGYELTLDKVDFYRREYPRTVICADSPVSKRKQIYAEYKANRLPKPEDALDALRAIQDRMSSWGVPVVQCEGYESDDLIGGLVKQAWPEEVQILGSEKDLYCLISDTVKLIGKSGLLGSNECFERWGVLPGQMTEWLALVGDTSDNIPGCPHCGPGRATDLLERFETIPGILAATDEEIRSVRGIGPKTLASLREWDPALALRLVQLLDDAPVELEALWRQP